MAIIILAMMAVTKGNHSVQTQWTAYSRDGDIILCRRLDRRQPERQVASIDIVVPCYQYARFLRDCVTSVLTQDIQNLRVLVIDDASNDNSAEIAAQLASEDPRVEVSIHRSNRGHIATYNEGIDWASSDYFLLLSADDLLAPGSSARDLGHGAAPRH